MIPQDQIDVLAPNGALLVIPKFNGQEMAVKVGGDRDGLFMLEYFLDGWFQVRRVGERGRTKSEIIRGFGGAKDGEGWMLV